MAFKMKGSALYGSPMKKYGCKSPAKMKSSPMLKKDCNCWDGYKRVAGTKPCAKGSCTKA
tara:strand:+ start:846 stop:1025 length:180 start_codon:yes stop_codon:yes gene_type:complete